MASTLTYLLPLFNTYASVAAGPRRRIIEEDIYLTVICSHWEHVVGNFLKMS